MVHIYFCPLSLIGLYKLQSLVLEKKNNNNKKNKKTTKQKKNKKKTKKTTKQKKKKKKKKCHPNPTRIVILVGDTSSCPVLHFYQVSSKYCEGYCRAYTKSNLNTRRGDKSKSKKASVLSFLYTTHHLILLYISNKYHQNIPKGIRVAKWTQTQIQTRRGGNYKSKKAKVVILVSDTSSHPVLHFYLVS